MKVGLNPHIGEFFGNVDRVRAEVLDTLELREEITHLIEVQPEQRRRRFSRERTEWSYINDGGDGTASFVRLTHELGLKHRYRRHDEPKFRHLVEPVVVADLWAPGMPMSSFVVFVRKTQRDVFYLVQHRRSVPDGIDRWEFHRHALERGYEIEDRPESGVFVDFDYLAVEKPYSISQKIEGNDEYAHLAHIRRRLCHSTHRLNL